MQPKKSLSRLTITTLFLLCFIPLVCAWGLFYTKNLWHLKTTAHGELLNPPISLDVLTLPADVKNQIQGHWLLMRVSQTDCDIACQQSLYFMRQIHIATGKDSHRVRRFWLTTTTPVPQMDPSFIPLINTLTPNAYQQFIHALQAHEKRLNLAQQPGVFIVDPHGNIVLAYDQSTPGGNILADLKKLLGVSGIG